MNLQDFEAMRKRLGVNRKNKRAIKHRNHVLRHDHRLHSMYSHIPANAFPKKARFRSVMSADGDLADWKFSYFEITHSDAIDAWNADLAKRNDRWAENKKHAEALRKAYALKHAN